MHHFSRQLRGLGRAATERRGEPMRPKALRSWPPTVASDHFRPNANATAGAPRISTEGLRSWRGAGLPALAGALVALLPRRSRANGLRVPNHSGSGRDAAGGLVITTATAARSAAWQTTARPLHRSAAWQRRAEWPTEPTSCDAPTITHAHACTRTRTRTRNRTHECARAPPPPTHGTSPESRCL